MAKTDSNTAEKASSPAASAPASHTETDHFAEGVHRFTVLLKDHGSYSAAVAAIDDEKGAIEYRHGLRRAATAFHTNSAATPSELVKLARQAVADDEAKAAAKKAEEERRAR